MVAERALLERRASFKPEALNEEAVAAAWEGRLFGGELHTNAGERLEVVYPGQRNFDAGPDFRDAIIAWENGLLQHGEVEIHVRASDWRSHGHSRDRRYDGVVLHVVMWDDVGHPTLLSNGAVAPVLALRPLLRVSLDVLRDKARQKPLGEERCSGILVRMEAEVLRRLIDRAGQLRLMAKAAEFEGAIAVKGAEQSLFEGVMEALGYAKNRKPFRQLAEHVPLGTLQGFLHGRDSNKAARRAQAILLGTAGLLPSQRRRAAHLDYAFAPFPPLEEEWKEYAGAPWMKEEDWVFFRTRPENFPTRRILGGAYLVARSLPSGLVDYLLRPLDASAPAMARRSLVARLMIDDGAGPASANSAPVRLIGRGRAMAIAVNVVLPFALACSSLTSRFEVADRARWAYATFPKLPSDAIIRQMNRQLFGVPSSGIVNSASRQQGLHYVYKEFCRRRRCEDCPFRLSSA